jgi:hypothetical protein
MNNNLEKKFLKYLLENPGNVLKGIFIIDSEYNLQKPGVLLTRDFYSFENTGRNLIKGSFGRIDIIFKYKGVTYCGEIKYQPFRNNDFWDALKVVGYTTYYKWQVETMGGEVSPQPAIFMPKNRIKLEHQIISGRLQIALFGIENKGEDYKLIPMTEIKGAARQIFE